MASHRASSYLLTMLLAATVALVAGCSSDELSSSVDEVAGGGDLRPTSPAEMESLVMEGSANSFTGEEQEVASADCTALADDGSEWTCEIRELGAKQTDTYFVEVSEDGEWAGTIDPSAAPVPSDDPAAATFKPIVHKGCGNRVLPPVDLPADATLRWAHPGGGYLVVRGEAADPESSLGYTKNLSVASEKSERSGEEFIEAGTYKGTEVLPQDADACWTLRFTPYG